MLSQIRSGVFGNRRSGSWYNIDRIRIESDCIGLSDGKG